MTEEVKKTQGSILPNYIIAIIASLIWAVMYQDSNPPKNTSYVAASESGIPELIGVALAPLIISAIISALISFFTKKKFSVVFAWTTVILVIVGTLGSIS